MTKIKYQKKTAMLLPVHIQAGSIFCGSEFLFYPKQLIIWTKKNCVLQDVGNGLSNREKLWQWTAKIQDQARLRLRESLSKKGKSLVFSQVEHAQVKMCH